MVPCRRNKITQYYCRTAPKHQAYSSSTGLTDRCTVLPSSVFCLSFFCFCVLAQVRRLFFVRITRMIHAAVGWCPFSAVLCSTESKRSQRSRTKTIYIHTTRLADSTRSSGSGRIDIGLQYMAPPRACGNACWASYELPRYRCVRCPRMAGLYYRKQTRRFCTEKFREPLLRYDQALDYTNSTILPSVLDTTIILGSIGNVSTKLRASQTNCHLPTTSMVRPPTPHIPRRARTPLRATRRRVYVSPPPLLNRHAPGDSFNATRT